MLSIDYNRTSNVFVDFNVGAKNHNFNIPLIFDKNNDSNAKIKIYSEIHFCYHYRVST